ncbi:MAG: hypothetical protein EHM89_05070 [Acidobacteria bacterium]|jgi:hypothetical protein|nr:MAG: hypothetical protein EHM89_05070 [Acidobacteriota bacterium]
MKHVTLLALVMVLAAGVGVATVQGQAGAKSQNAIGAVKTVSGSTFTVDTGKSEMKFTVNEETNILAKGASTKTRAKKAAGEGGLTIADVVHVGDQIVVRYVEAGGNLVASEIEVRNPRPASAQPVK